MGAAELHMAHFQVPVDLYMTTDVVSVEPSDSLARASRRKTLTLLYASRDPHRNNAVALAGYLMRQGGIRSRRNRRRENPS